MSEIGKITRVQTATDEANILVDVNISPTREHEEIPFRSPQPGVWFVPSVGDVVEVTAYGENQNIAHSPIQLPSFRIPEGVDQGDIVIQLNDSSYLQFRKQGDGSYDIEMDCDGDIFIGSDGNRERVATESHTHSYTWGDTAGSGTTDPPDAADLTDTEIE